MYQPDRQLQKAIMVAVLVIGMVTAIIPFAQNYIYSVKEKNSNNQIGRISEFMDKFSVP